MDKRQVRREYVKPQVHSERVFEHAALACSLMHFNLNLPGLKAGQATCGYHHS